jgi:tetratricopeptide (TPR) repeat protein
MPTIVFVSHASEDDAMVNRLYEPMLAAGLTPWIDHRNGIHYGEEWETRIQEGVNQCHIGLFVLSPRSAKSKWCSVERNRILDDGKPLYVALIETTDSKDFPIRLTAIQYADLRTDFDKTLAELIAVMLNPASADGDAPKPIQERRLTGKLPPLLRVVPLCGRQEDVATVTGKLREAPVQIVGVGGLGKSRLAAEVVRVASPEAGAVWHFCTPNSSAALLQAEMQKHYRLETKSDPQPLLDAVEQRPALVVVDNGEDVPLAERVGYVEFIHSLHAVGAGVVLTSRDVWDKLRPLFVHDPSGLDAPTAAQAARELAKGLNVQVREEEITALVTAAHHHPGLIEWGMEQMSEGGGREPERVIADIAALQSEDAQARLDEMILSDLRRADDAAAGAEAALRALVVFEGGFVLAAAAAVCGVDTLALEKVLSALQKGRFIRRDSATRRYSIAPLVMTVFSPTANAQAAHFAWYAAGFSDVLANRNPEQQRVIDAEFVNLRAALRYGAQFAPQPAADLAWALKLYLLLRDAYGLAREIMSELLAAAEGIGYALGVGRMKLALGDLDLREAQYAAARANYALALTAFRALPDRLGEAYTLKALGDLDYMEDQYAAARANYALALTAFRALPDRLGEAYTLQALGDLDLREAQYAAARANYALALTAYRAIPSRLGEANTLKALGDLDSMEAQYAAARQHYTDALALAEQIPDSVGQLNCLSGLARLEKAEGNLPAARDFMRRCLALADSIEAFRAHPGTQSLREELASWG